MQDILAEFSEGVVASAHDEDAVACLGMLFDFRDDIGSFFDEKGVFTTFFDLSFAGSILQIEP